MPILSALAGLWDDVVCLLFPRLCIGCQEKEVDKGQFFCASCMVQVSFTDHFDQENNAVVQHFYGRIPLDHGAALVLFSEGGVVQKMIHRLKYNRDLSVGAFFGEYGGKLLQQPSKFNKIDLVLPVPLHISKLHQRGYNQSDVFGQALANTIKIPYDNRVLIKILNTSSQTRKSRQSRIDNVQNSIAITDKEKIRGKHILLVDDVITTGATLEVCGKILLDNGARSVSVLSIALAV